MKSIKILIAFVSIMAVSCNEDTPTRPAAFNGSIETFAGTTTFGYDGDGAPAISAKFGYVSGIAVDAMGNVYISDLSSATIRKINTANIIHTVAGTFVGFYVVDPLQYSGDGGAATSAHLNTPMAVAVDPAGNIFISDSGNNVLRKVDANGEISTFVSNNLINNPYGIAIDGSGNIYLADSQNHAIRKITSAGQMTTIAGTLGQSGYSGDGGDATAAKLNMPSGIAIDQSGNIYISDNNSVIRQISTLGKITTIAGTGEEGYFGDRGKPTDAKLHAPKGIAIAADGSILFADSRNNRIRRISPDGELIDTIAGTGETGYFDNVHAMEAKLSSPQALAVASNGYIYVADTGNSVIRVIKPAN